MNCIYEMHEICSLSISTKMCLMMIHVRLGFHCVRI